MKKINFEVTCKLNRFSYWNSCNRKNFVNVATLRQKHNQIGIFEEAYVMA